MCRQTRTRSGLKPPRDGGESLGVGGSRVFEDFSASDFLTAGFRASSPAYTQYPLKADRSKMDHTLQCLLHATHCSIYGTQRTSQIGRPALLAYTLMGRKQAENKINKQITFCQIAIIGRKGERWAGRGVWGVAAFNMEVRITFEQGHEGGDRAMGRAFQT